MAEVLSQSEIDDLLRSLSEGSVDLDEDLETTTRKKPVLPYDFARPQKVNKEQQRTLEIIYDSYCRSLASFLSGYLRTSVAIEVLSAEQVTFNEFSNALTNPCILSIIEIAPLKGSIIFEISANIGYAVIDRILGGPGTGMKQLRDFSEIEKILLERVVTHMLAPLPAAWENVQEIRPRLNQIETNAQFAQIIAPTETTALVTMAIRVGTVEGLMNFCLPITVIEPVLDRLYTRYWFTQAKGDDDIDYACDLQTKIEKADISISAVVGRTSIMVSEFVNLNVGDVMVLDTFTDSDLEIFVGPLRKFYAKPGISRGRNAIQITKLIQREE
ncbi:MAG: flagellar motor switch protein FliM [Clostridiales bacterium]|jgi:flagellar motor switch protein FliM|nr:flagellar motor switch protein FliM [Clostridiales bacterium]